MSRIRFIAALSLVYDGSVGVLLLAGRPLLARLFDVPLPQPPIHADLNGIFLLAVAIGYLIPFRDPEHGRGYLWVMGPGLKGAGAVTFVLDRLLRGSPASFLLFAFSDGVMALATLWALVTTPRASASTSRAEYLRP